MTPLNKEFKRIKKNINSMREHAELLSSVREDISEYKASGSLSPRMQLLRERAAIHGSISHIDDLISQAQTTRAALGTRRGHCLEMFKPKSSNLVTNFPSFVALLVIS